MYKNTTKLLIRSYYSNSGGDTRQSCAQDLQQCFPHVYKHVVIVGERLNFPDDLQVNNYITPTHCMSQQKVHAQYL